MGFLKNLLDEAGKKTGSAIGNRLFPEYTDYVRLGPMPGVSYADQQRAQRRAAREQFEMQQQASQFNDLLNIDFSPTDIEQNIAALTKVAAVIDSLQSHDLFSRRSDQEERTYNMALSMMRSGIMICKIINPNHPALAYFERRY